MIYQQFKDKKLSWLGMGGMRLPKTAPDGPIDEVKARELIEHAYKSGVNYYDTAYFYHGGESERVIGEILNQFPRDTWYLADKMPGNFMRYLDNGKVAVDGVGDMKTKEIDHVSEIFEFQLEKCGVDYFDFYLLHNVSENTYDIYTDDKLAMVEYLVKEKKAGRIKHFGFSAHGRAETIESFLKYTEGLGLLNEIEFCMIQCNYLDWTLQEASKKHEVLTRYGIPVFIMEPVRGGKLCSLTGDAAEMLKAARPNDPQVAWAFRFLQSLENTPVLISGMSSMEQLKENLTFFEKEDPLTAADQAVLDKVVGTIAELAPCTACRYCMDACPKALNIPVLLSLYNEAGYEVSWTIKATLKTLEEGKLPAACIACGLCNPLCPQNIDIPEALKKFNGLLEAAQQ